MSALPHSEFHVGKAFVGDRTSALRWVLSHLRRYPHLLIGFFAVFLTAWAAYGYARIVIGQAAEAITVGPTPRLALVLGGVVALLLLVDSAMSLSASLLAERMAARIEANGREELYVSLLGKSQTFHDRQRIGDVMARANDDVKQLNMMLSPGLLFMTDMVMGFAVPIFFLATVDLRLLLAPALLIAFYIPLVQRYITRLDPVVGAQRESFGNVSAVLEESISGIEVVKASAQEAFERRKFGLVAATFRNHFVQQGRIEAVYLPLLAFWLCYALLFFQGIWLYRNGALGIAQLVSGIALMDLLRWPTIVSLFSFSLWRLGFAGANRILDLVNTETEMDANEGGHSARVDGAIVFENVTFGYDDGDVLSGVSFSVAPGQTLAIVGQTGSGKSTLTQLVNRTYDVTAGRVLVDGVDVRDWDLDTLRRQIGKIEQDVYLFSRSVGENIAFSRTDATQDEIEAAAQDAQVHNFIMGFPDRYDTVVGERGTMLSGGQRQRIALARAFLSDPRILILDDSTSAIDSATEDEIQKALRRAQQGRTTLMITHRLSQIRWADKILLLDGGKLVAQGTHAELLQSSPLYQRIFARYEAAPTTIAPPPQPARAPLD